MEYTYPRMVQQDTPLDHGSTQSTVLAVAFCEACERLIFVRALLDDPRLETRRQGSAVVNLLSESLAAIERRLQDLRSLAYAREDGEATARVLAGLGVVVAGLHQVHAQLGLLGARWPLGTADLFVRKLVAEGVPVAVPTLCPSTAVDGHGTHVGQLLQDRLAAVGVYPIDLARFAPILTLPAVDLLDPLSWAALIVPLAAHHVRTPGVVAQVPGTIDTSQDAYLRAGSALVAARLLGESAYAACATRAILTRLSGGSSMPGLAHLFHASIPLSKPVWPAADQTLSEYYAGILDQLASRGAGWGRVESSSLDADTVPWETLRTAISQMLPAPQLPDPETIEHLFTHLRDGRPINAYPPRLPDGFEAQLRAGDQAASFYALLEHADERPCSLATILAVGWRYKVRQTYAHCTELMAGTGQWRTCLDLLAAHVLERCALLQQSIEAAYVQQVFARWRDA